MKKWLKTLAQSWRNLKRDTKWTLAIGVFSIFAYLGFESASLGFGSKIVVNVVDSPSENPTQTFKEPEYSINPTETGSPMSVENPEQSTSITFIGAKDNLQSTVSKTHSYFYEVESDDKNLLLVFGRQCLKMRLV